MEIVNKGMCPPLQDEEFFNLLTSNGTIFIDLVIGCYPELIKFVRNANNN